MNGDIKFNIHSGTLFIPKKEREILYISVNNHMNILMFSFKFNYGQETQAMNR